MFDQLEIKHFVLHIPFETIFSLFYICYAGLFDYVAQFWKGHQDKSKLK